MSDDAKEIERLVSELGTIASALFTTNAIRGNQLIGLAVQVEGLCRRLLEERDHILKSLVDERAIYVKHAKIAKDGLQETRLPEQIEKALVLLRGEHYLAAIGELGGKEASAAFGSVIDNLRTAIRLALDEARDEALEIVRAYHEELGLSATDCCDIAVSTALTEVASALKSKRT